MLMERQEQCNLFEALLPFSLVEMDPDLNRINEFLDKHPDILLTFTDQLRKRSKNSKTMGRPSEPAEAIFRMLILRRHTTLSFRAAQKAVNDSLVLRKFTRIYYEQIPNYSTLAKYDQLLNDEVLKKINEHIVGAAKEQKVTTGRKLRMDTTVVEANIHYPTDSHLLYDGIKVVSRLAGKCRKLGIAAGEVTRSYARSSKKQLLKIVKFARSRGEEGQKLFKQTYKKLVDITKRCVAHAKQLVTVYIKDKTSKAAKCIGDELTKFIPLIESVIDQTERRVFKGQSVSNAEKLISIFQPDMYTIRKGKRAKLNEFGKLLELQQCDGKIISNWNVHTANVADVTLFVPAIKTHTSLFGKPPRLACGDRGYYSEDNETDAKHLGVAKVHLPKRGKKSKDRLQYEKQRWFRAGHGFRAGIEGTISVLKRRHGFDRCMNTGHNAFERWIGWGIISYNLAVIAKA